MKVVLLFSWDKSSPDTK